MDKNVSETNQRWKIIILFKNRDVKELVHAKGEYHLLPYLRNEDEVPEKLPGSVEKIFRDRNDVSQPVFFLLKN